MDICEIIQIVALATGLVYMVMQVLQHKYMWYFSLLTSGAALAVTIMNHLWASSAINVYFVVMSVVGMISWRAQENKDRKGEVLRLVKLTRPVMVISAAAVLFGGTAIFLALRLTNDPNPIVDAATFIISIVATWWLTRYHIEQWYAWIAADLIAIALYVSQGLWEMAALFFFYIVSAVIGLIHWRRCGEYV